MEPRAHHVLIGLFAIVTLGSILLFALWLSKSSAERDYDYYEIRFNQVVSGLAAGNAVQYNGIKVGDVLDLYLDPEDPSQVRALIRVYSDVPVKRDTRASLMLANVTGSMSIQLYGGTPQSPRLVSDPEQPAVIVAEPSLLRTFLADGETLMSSLDQLLSPENIGRIERILVDIEQITTTLVAQRGELAQAMTNFNRAGQQANTLLEQQGSKAFNSVQRAMAALERSSSQIESLLTGNAASVNRGLGQLGPALSELNSVLNNLDRFTRRLEENPSDYLFNRDAIEGFSP